MENYKAEILAEVKTLLKISKDDEDDILNLIIDGAVNYCLAYCRLEFLPYQLYGIVAQMCSQYYKSENVKSISEGDRKIEFSPSAENRLKPFVNRRGFVPSQRMRVVENV